MSKEKKIRFHYYEDPETHAYIKKLDHWEGGKWVRTATKERMEKDLGLIPTLKVKALAVKKK